jgi:hypothetical protein
MSGMSEITALNLEQTLELVKQYVKDNDLSPDHVNDVFKIIYQVCTPGRQYQPHQVLYDQKMVQETLDKIRLE